jgi:hypothetical protein
MGRTRKPCPGCKKVYSGRVPDDVCFDCKRVLEIGRERLAEIKAASAAVSVPEQSHWLPYLHNVNDSGLVDEYRKALLTLVRVTASYFGKHVGGGDTGQLFRGSQGSNQLALLTQPQIDALREMVDVVKRAVKAANQSGIEEGQSFIVGLASGTVSINEFNQATMGEDND